jgi:hypothetical protein
MNEHGGKESILPSMSEKLSGSLISGLDVFFLYLQEASMNRAIYILIVIAIVLCSTALPAGAQQSEQEILNSLNNTLQTVAYSTQNPRNNYIEQWNNSYQFAVTENHLVITYRLENTFFKGEEIQDHYIETGTYSAPLAMLSQAGISSSPQTTQIAIACNEEAACFIREYSGEYEQKGKITTSEDTKFLRSVGLLLPEDLIGSTIDLLQELLYP